jgi:hypothetical protein
MIWGACSATTGKPAASSICVATKANRSLDFARSDAQRAARFESTRFNKSRMLNPPLAMRLCCAALSMQSSLTPNSPTIATRTSTMSAASSITASVVCAAMSSSTSSRSLSWSAARYAPTPNAVTWGVRPEARMMSGILSRTSCPHRALPSK